VTLATSLREAQGLLSGGGIDDAALEAEVLLRLVLGITRSQLYVSPDRELGPDERARYRGFVARRLAGEPTAYIAGRREFYGLEFQVDRRVLIPRPESELLVEEAVRLGRDGAGVFADIGTGSGAIAVSVAVHLPRAIVYATDISPDALEVAAANARRHAVEARVTLLHGDLLAPLPGRVDVIIANLPYVPRAQLAAVNTQGYEPPVALDGGADGLDLIRRLTAQASDKLNPGGSLLLEVGQGQHGEVAGLLMECSPGAAIRVLADLAGIRRVVALTLPA
jgi:release factor glutamine methyltransferase